MNNEPNNVSVAIDSEITGKASRTRTMAMIGAVIALILAFASPLVSLIAYAAGSDVHSHVLLIPVICGYLLYLQQRQLPKPGTPSILGAVILVAIAVIAVMIGRKIWPVFPALSLNDYLTLMTFGFVCSLAAAGFLILGKNWMRAAAFPVAFLIFFVPLPDAVVTALETASKYASAEVANWFLSLAGVPMVRDGLFFQIPGITIEVAQECSGIRSSLVLIITSLLAAHLFLRSPWRKLILVALVIPLGILRNGFRIFVIGSLCVNVGPEMIESPVHRQGGPLFFALSLIPLFFLLWWLRRGERPERAVRLPIPATN